MLVVGAPGSGKSYFVRALVMALRASGKSVDLLAKTHGSMQNFGLDGAQTADRWVRRIRSGGCVTCDVVCVDEITQVEVQLWASICKFALSGVAFILCGDFQQFSAICEHWAGCPVSEGSLEKSHMVRELAGSNRLTLTANRRSDQALFDFYTSLEHRPLAEALQEGRMLYPLTSPPAETTRVIRHARRRFLNCKRNLRDKPVDAVFLKAPPMDGNKGNGPQSMWVYPGLRIVGAGGMLKKGFCYEYRLRLTRWRRYIAQWSEPYCLSGDPLSSYVLGDHLRGVPRPHSRRGRASRLYQFSSLHL